MNQHQQPPHDLTQSKADDESETQRGSSQPHKEAHKSDGQEQEAPTRVTVHAEGLDLNGVQADIGKLDAKVALDLEVEGVATLEALVDVSSEQVKLEVGELSLDRAHVDANLRGVIDVLEDAVKVLRARALSGAKIVPEPKRLAPGEMIKEVVGDVRRALSED